MDHQLHRHGDAATTESAVDPVCGMTVDPHKTSHRHVHGGRPYYFRSAGCRAKFAAAPEK
jgi:Cu+-exporting ATPase